jgi:hypothetical protein
VAQGLAQSTEIQYFCGINNKKSQSLCHTAKIQKVFSDICVLKKKYLRGVIVIALSSGNDFKFTKE